MLKVFTSLSTDKKQLTTKDSEVKNGIIRQKANILKKVKMYCATANAEPKLSSVVLGIQ